MTLALVIAGLVLALIEEFQAAGKSILGWAVVLLALSLLVGRL